MRLRKPMRDWRCRWRSALIVLVFAVLAGAAEGQGREIADLFGKKVVIPDCPQKVYSTSPPVTYLLYAIDPSMLAGLNFPVREREKRYLRKRMQELPVLGGWFGQGNVPNLEMIVKVHPELVVTSKQRSAMQDKVEETMRKLPMPAINVVLDALSDYPAAFSYLGRVLGREARGEELAAYARRTLSEAAALAASVRTQERVSVYYAEGVDGLSTECDASQHAELIPLVGGGNVHRCQAGGGYGMEKIAFEQLMLYKPEVMLVMEDAFYRTAFSDPRWQLIKAVRDKRVYRIPNQPFNWFDRPPSFMRLLGAKWLAHLLYPERRRADMAKETREFFRLFFQVNIGPEEARELLRF